MKTLESNSLAAMEFELRWQSKEASHRELFFGPNVNMWRDIFLPEIEKEILGASENEIFTFSFEPGIAVPKFSAAKVLKLATGQFSEIMIGGRKIPPGFGRFYPSGLLRNVAGIFPQSLEPFRIIGLDETGIRVDLNHPLSRYELQLKIKIRKIKTSAVERGGRCTDWLEEFTSNGPGMQARANGNKTGFENIDSYKRDDEDDDSRFYNAPRPVGHIDDQAASTLRGIYGEFLNKKERVLDLMSSVHSHLPRDYDLTVTGLGLNRAELRKNPALSSHVVHDLNETGLLPFSSNVFDVVVCSLSIEYLTRPREIISEISRVLSPGGRVLISFSNRWFPAKVTRLWLEIHDFERLGLVLDYLLEEGGFSEFCTISARNWPRPANDRYAAEIGVSDPVFVVAATRKPQ